MSTIRFPEVPLLLRQQAGSCQLGSCVDQTQLKSKVYMQILTTVLSLP